MTPTQKLEAIRAIINGEYDNEQLKKIGLLFASDKLNIQKILELRDEEVDFKKALYESDLCTGERTDDSVSVNDYGAYWLRDVTVEEVFEFMNKLYNV